MGGFRQWLLQNNFSISATGVACVSILTEYQHCLLYGKICDTAFCNLALSFLPNKLPTPFHLALKYPSGHTQHAMCFDLSMLFAHVIFSSGRNFHLCLCLFEGLAYTSPSVEGSPNCILSFGCTPWPRYVFIIFIQHSI